MRFKFDLSWPTASLLLATTFVVYLGLTGQLTLYIHPRYVIFTVVMAAIGLFLLLVNSVSEPHHHDPHPHSRMTIVALAFLLTTGILLPARTLTSQTVSQRITDSSTTFRTSDQQSNSSLFSGSSRNLGLGDWARLLATNSDPAFYVNRTASFSGFVYDADLGDNTVWLARFVVTCCAVDAQPVGVPVQIENWRSELGEDEWVEVEGRFGVTQTVSGQQLVLIPDSVEKIEQPLNPYAN